MFWTLWTNNTIFVATNVNLEINEKDTFQLIVTIISDIFLKVTSDEICSE